MGLKKLIKKAKKAIRQARDYIHHEVFDDLPGFIHNIFFKDTDRIVYNKPVPLIDVNSAANETGSITEITSSESAFIPFETLHRGHFLDTTPVYNYWEPNEFSRDDDRSNMNFDDIPRYVYLTWDKSPDMTAVLTASKPEAATNPDARMVFTKLSPFGYGAYSVTPPSTKEGMDLVPSHLSEDGFETNARNSANEFVFAGAVEAVISNNKNEIVSGSADVVYKQMIDEDAFLIDHEKWYGINIDELRSAIAYSRSVFTTYSGRVANNSAKPFAVPDGAVGQNSISSPIPGYSTLTIDSNTSFDSDLNKGSVIEKISEEVPFSENIDDGSDRVSVKVKFLNKNFDGMLSKERVRSANSYHNAENIIGLAQAAPSLAAQTIAGIQSTVKKLAIPSVPATDNLPVLEYCGYEIEKSELKSSGFEHVDTFYIPGRDYTEYYDTEVKYGAVYRYRIRSVLRWCRDRNFGVFDIDRSISNAPLDRLPKAASFFHGEWDDDWSYAQILDQSPPSPPTEFSCAPMSDTRCGGPYIAVTTKAPYNPQLDISSMALFRKEVYTNGQESSWTELTSSNSVRPIAYTDKNVKYNGVNNINGYIYAAVCRTRHNEESAFSDQMFVRLNANWRRDGELPVKMTSYQGVNRLTDVGVFTRWPPNRARLEFIVGNNKQVKFETQPRQQYNARINGSRYVARFESLLTGQKINLVVNQTSG